MQYNNHIEMNNQQPPMFFDPFVYNNKILTDNITGITSSLQMLVNLYVESQKNHDTISKLTNELEETKKQLRNSQLLLTVQRIIEKDKGCGDNNVKGVKSRWSDTNQNNNKFEYGYKTFAHRIHNLSWNEEKVNSVMASIKSIDDIIILDGEWNKLKHNLILQRLYFLIPPLKRLKNMIGLDNIKKDVFKKIIYYTMNPVDNNNFDEYLNTIISGPPGVGKTEFAKIYADIFLRLGILKNNKFIEIKRDDLVGQYLGQTAMKTRELLEKADGGVLFLDEAYSLGNFEKRDSYSKEAIDMINQYLSERKGKFMFIIAGYEDDLETCLFAYNKGLQRRFHSHYKIKGYEANELKDIFIGMVNKTKFNINITEEDMIKFFADNKDHFIHYAGDVEKILNEVKQVQSLRVFNSNSKPPFSKDIIIDDIKSALIVLIKKEEEKPPYGMYI
jgi:stage V sporulation protein K